MPKVNITQATPPRNSSKPLIWENIVNGAGWAYENLNPMTWLGLNPVQPAGYGTPNATTTSTGFWRKIEKTAAEMRAGPNGLTLAAFAIVPVLIAVTVVTVFVFKKGK